MTDPQIESWIAEFERRHAERVERVSTDRTFTILGETFTVKPSVAPDVALTFNDVRQKLETQTQAAIEAREAGKEAPDPLITDAELLGAFEATARACLTSGSVKAWENLRSPNRPQPLGWAELFELCSYFIARASAVPTDALADSSNGQVSADHSLKAGSSSKVVTRKRSPSRTT